MDRLLHLRRYAASPPAAAACADLVLVSHLHADHCHLPSLRRFGRDVPAVVPRGGEELLESLGRGRLVPVEPGDVLDLAGVRVEVLDATHDGRRLPWSRLSAPALGFRVASGGASAWFPGDTELRADMHDVAPVDLALVPVGGWGPTLAEGHLGPQDAAEAVSRIGARWALPVHWGTFWPVGLDRLARANHERLFSAPGDRFADALVGAEPVPALHGRRVEL